MATASSQKSSKPVRTQCPGLDHEMAELDGGPPVGKEGGICLRAPNESWLSRPEHRFLASFLTPEVFKPGSAWAQGFCSAVLGPWLEGVPSCFLDLNADSSDFAHFTFWSSD